MDPTRLQLPETSTCLSPSVHRLITHHTHSQYRDENMWTSEGLLDFTYIRGKLPEPPEAEGYGGNVDQYFSNCVKALAPMFQSVEDGMEKKGKAGLSSCFDQLLSWTGQEQILLDVWGTMYDHDDIADMLVLLVSTAILERSLGDLYLTRGPPPCPSMLKDLLLTKELQQILGGEIIQVLRVLIGPPISLNLRNVAWHGFPYPGEIPRRCIWFIILLVPSIGKVLHQAGIQTIIHREPVHLTTMKRVSDISLTEHNHDSWIQHVETSKLVSWKSRPYWETVVQHYRDGRYTFCAALLLVFLEQGLRRVFATVNNCHHRVLTAEATTLFTTFDEILGPFLLDGSDNALQNVLGTHVMEILMDLLAYQDGPRLRDRLSHGELEWTGNGLPGEIIHSLMAVTVHVTALFSQTSASDQSEELKQISAAISGYKVQFHRIALIQEMVQLNADTALGVDAIVCYLPDLSERDSQSLYPLTESYLSIEADVNKLSDLVCQNWRGCNIDGKLNESLTYRGCAQCRDVFEQVLSHKILTLYREAKQPMGPLTSGAVDREGELLSVLHHIVGECNTILSHVRTCATCRQGQLERKELRSRQRENFKKFLNSFPSLVLVTNVCGLLVMWQLYYLDSQDHDDEAYFRSRIKFWKAVLQFCENLRTLSHPDKNKWTEGLELTSKFVKALPLDFETKLVLKRNKNNSLTYLEPPSNKIS